MSPMLKKRCVNGFGDSMALLVFFFLFGFVHPAAGQGTDDDGIHVSGAGEILAEPDIARMTLQVTRQGRDAAALKDEMDKVTANVLKLTDSLGIDRKDVTAAIVQIHPNRVYENGRQSIDGVIASRSIEITLRDLDDIGALMNRSLALGINNISGVQLDTSRRPDLELEAMDLAIANARSLAERVARGFDVRLLGVRRVAVHGPVSVQPEMAMARMAADGGDSFSAGQIRIRRDVQATFAIGGQ